jgi:hypothetical protein
MLPGNTTEIFLLRPFSLLFLMLTAVVIGFGIWREMRSRRST